MHAQRILEFMAELPEFVVSHSDELAECCAHLANCSIFGFDTEFIGEDSYHPLLCLVQVATPEQIETELPWTNLLDFAFAPDSLRLAATDDSGHLILWDIPGQRVITNLAAHAGATGFIGTGFMAGGHSLLTYDEGGAKLKRTWRRWVGSTPHRQSAQMWYASSSQVSSIVERFL